MEIRDCSAIQHTSILLQKKFLNSHCGNCFGCSFLLYWLQARVRLYYWAYDPDNWILRLLLYPNSFVSIPINWEEKQLNLGGQ